MLAAMTRTILVGACALSPEARSALSSADGTLRDFITFFRPFRVYGRGRGYMEVSLSMMTLVTRPYDSVAMMRRAIEKLCP